MTTGIIIDCELQRDFAGCDSDLIMENLRILASSGVPYTIRSLVPGVTNTLANLDAIAKTVGGLLRVNLLAYIQAAGAKYPAAGIKFVPGYNESQAVNIDLTIIENAGIKVRAV